MVSGKWPRGKGFSFKKVPLNQKYVWNVNRWDLNVVSMLQMSRPSIERTMSINSWKFRSFFQIILNRRQIWVKNTNICTCTSIFQHSTVGKQIFNNLQVGGWGEYTTALLSTFPKHPIKCRFVLLRVACAWGSHLFLLEEGPLNV